MKIVPLIFAAGKGTRLRPLTYETPKPLVPIKNGLSMIDINIENLVKHGFAKIFITISYKKALFEKLVNKYQKSVEILLLEEKTGNGGHIAPIRDNFELLKSYDAILGLNGDTYVDCKLEKLLKVTKKETMLILGSSDISTLPKQLICQNNKLIGINTKQPYYYSNVNNHVELRNNIGLYIIPISFIQLVIKTKGNTGMFGKKDLVDIAVRNRKKVECINLKVDNFWSFNTMKDLEYVKRSIN